MNKNSYIDAIKLIRRHGQRLAFVMAKESYNNSRCDYWYSVMYYIAWELD